jgi:hypothetical protein
MWFNTHRKSERRVGMGMWVSKPMEICIRVGGTGLAMALYGVERKSWK